jgi:hypothetical protein
MVHSVTVGKIRDSLQVQSAAPGGDQASEEGLERPGALPQHLSGFVSDSAAASPDETTQLTAQGWKLTLSRGD